jgi:hypothetical protein
MRGVKVDASRRQMFPSKRVKHKENMCMEYLELHADPPTMRSETAHTTHATHPWTP